MGGLAIGHEIRPRNDALTETGFMISAVFLKSRDAPGDFRKSDPKRIHLVRGHSRSCPEAMTRRITDFFPTPGDRTDQTDAGNKKEILAILLAGILAAPGTKDISPKARRQAVPNMPIFWISPKVHPIGGR